MTPFRSAPMSTVLLVEHEPLLARVTGQMLTKSASSRHALTHCRTLAAALERLRTEDFDIVLLDLNLPDSNARDGLQSVLAEAPEVPVVVLTATQSYESGPEAIKLGAQDFLVKGDFNFLALDRAIAYAIERHRLQRTIRQLAVLDELTGFYNRRGFNALYPDILSRAQQPGACGYLCFFDLDRFKQINDELGHRKGDEALVEFAAALRGAFPKDALLLRFGGDEFVAMGVSRWRGAAREAIRALEDALSARNRAGAPFALESSAGLAEFDRDGPKRIEELTAAADAALYRDKKGRRQQGAAAGCCEACR